MAETGFIQEMQHEKADVHSDDQGVHINWSSDKALNVAIKWMGKSLAIICDNVRERLKRQIAVAIVATYHWSLFHSDLLHFILTAIWAGQLKNESELMDCK